MTTVILFLSVVALMGTANAAMVLRLKSSRRRIVKLKQQQLYLQGRLESIKAGQ